MKNKKDIQFKQAKPLSDAFIKTCKEIDKSQKECKKLIDKRSDEIGHYEVIVKRLQEEIQRKKQCKCTAQIILAIHCITVFVQKQRINNK